MTDDKSIPNHIAIILDGNRRFAKKLLNHPFKGHEWGAKKIENFLNWSRDYGIKQVTFWAFSLENFNRPKEEFDYLMDIFRENFAKLKDNKDLFENKIKVRVIGRYDMFPKDIADSMREVMELTKDHDRYIVNFAMAYGGRGELLDATNKIAKDVKAGKIEPGKIDKDTFEKYLYMKDQPDLIIRTGGARRTSGFLIWQADYAEYYFLDKFWPEFEKEDFEKCMQEYSERERRFGR